MIKLIAKSINQKPPRLRIPKYVGLIASYILETCGKIIGVKSPLFPARVRIMTMNYYYNIEKARREVNYNPQTSFEKGIKLTGQWLLKNKLL
jgi:nucleoside-diphosphate-sugar epimerase